MKDGSISKKFVAFIIGEVLVMTSLYWMLSKAPEVLTEHIGLLVIAGIIGLAILYGFSNVVNNLIKSKWYRPERFKSEQK